MLHNKFSKDKDEGVAVLIHMCGKCLFMTFIVDDKIFITCTALYMYTYILCIILEVLSFILYKNVR